MRSFFLFIIALSVLFILSCKKDHSGNETPPEPEPETETGFSKLKKITETYWYKGRDKSESTYEINYDSANNKVAVKIVSAPNKYISTYSYNSADQLIQYEETPINTTQQYYRMNFVRDGNGQLIKVLSERYNNGISEASEGICQYTKEQDTSFVTFIDTAKQNWEMYRIGMINNRIVSSINYFHNSNSTITPFRTDCTYDTSGNLISNYTGSAPSGTMLTIKRGNVVPITIKKFFDRMVGDVPWLTIYKTRYLRTLPLSSPFFFTGPVVESMKEKDAFWDITWDVTNEYDSFGNLKKFIARRTPAVGFVGEITYEFEYYP